MIDWIVSALGFTPRRDSPRAGITKLKARFDAAGSDHQTRRNWKHADALSPDAAANPATRATVRQRSRYERFNNGFTCGAVRTIANETIGVGPIMQLLTPNETVNQAVEARWVEWAKAARLGARLRLARMTKCCDGEVFIRLRTNPRLSCAVKLDLQLLEADQIATPWDMLDRQGIDGIEYDEYDNPLWYYVLAEHPGSANPYALGRAKYLRIPAIDMVHYAILERPGQHRAMPESVATLNLNAIRRGYRESVVAAARAAAQMGAVVLESDMDADDEDMPAQMSSVPLEHGMMTVAPYGMKPHQMRPEQPSTGYGDLDDRLVTEGNRPLSMPKNIARGDSSQYNYASGRLDHQSWDRANLIEQSEIEQIVLMRIVTAWAIEATAIPGYLPARAGQVYLPTRLDPSWPVPCEWIWGEREHVDPTKGANSQKTKLGTFATTLSREAARDRRDWRELVAQAGREHAALDDVDLVAIDGQTSRQVLDVLRTVDAIGETAAVEMLTLLSVSRSKATRMVKAVMESAKPVAPSNGNGEVASSSVAHRIL